MPRSYQRVDDFAAAVGHQPNLLLYYSRWGKPFDVLFAGKALARGATPVVQMDPGTTSLRAIAGGRYDGYLRSFASQVRGFSRPVVVGFAREMNGWWYPWAFGHVSASTWIAAWRHVVTVFRENGASNVTWQWTINDLGPRIGPPARWWPGAAYVTWVGIDGYYYNSANNFGNVVGTTISAVRAITDKPIMLSEVAIAPQAHPVAQMPALFTGIRQRHLLGLVWFDAPAHRNWRLEDDPPALRAFRRQVAGISAFVVSRPRVRRTHPVRAASGGEGNPGGRFVRRLPSCVR